MKLNRARHQRRQICWAITITLLIGAAYQLGSASYVLAKANVAQVLIGRAWSENVRQGATRHKPWSWADTTPVARLHFVNQRASMIVMSGDSGRVLAFGPGHSSRTPLPGDGGNSVISGHRDTHFSVLRTIKPGDLVSVETLRGETVHYRVEDRRVVDQSRTEVTEDHGRDELTLVTCWPFDALVANGAERLVVTARRTDIHTVASQSFGKQTIDPTIAQLATRVQTESLTK